MTQSKKNRIVLVLSIILILSYAVVSAQSATVGGNQIELVGDNQFTGHITQTGKAATTALVRCIPCRKDTSFTVNGTRHVVTYTKREYAIDGTVISTRCADMRTEALAIIRKALKIE